MSSFSSHEIVVVSLVAFVHVIVNIFIWLLFYQLLIPKKRRTKNVQLWELNVILFIIKCYYKWLLHQKHAMCISLVLSIVANKRRKVEGWKNVKKIKER
jgi:hypothetical protein